jgi:hypothetical protein
MCVKNPKSESQNPKEIGNGNAANLHREEFASKLLLREEDET